MQTKPGKSLSIIIWMNISQLDYNLIKTDTEFQYGNIVHFYVSLNNSIKVIPRV